MCAAVTSGGTSSGRVRRTPRRKERFSRLPLKLGHNWVSLFLVLQWVPGGLSSNPEVVPVGSDVTTVDEGDAVVFSGGRTVQHPPGPSKRTKFRRETDPYVVRVTTP